MANFRPAYWLTIRESTDAASGQRIPVLRERISTMDVHSDSGADGGDGAGPCAGGGLPGRVALDAGP